MANVLSRLTGVERAGNAADVEQAESVTETVAVNAARAERAGSVGGVQPTSRPRRVILVRHAMPDVDPAVPPRRWRLGAPGRAAARRLSLPADAYLVASTEPKAAETLLAATDGRPVVRDAGFDEVGRPGQWRADHREQAGAYVAGAAHPGWEPRAAVVGRFTAAVARHGERAGDRPLVVGSHGMALTCWLAAHQMITGPPEVFWAALAFPDVVEVSASAGR